MIESKVIIKENSRLSHWEPLLQQWIKCFDQFCRVSNTIPVLSKKEQTNVGVLAGAAWKMGWVAFQEMSRKKPTNRGYCDLWLSNSTSSDYIECKGGWVDNHLSAYKLLERACNDVKSLNIDDDPSDFNRVGVSFSNLYFPESIDSHVERSKEIITKLCEFDGHDAIAWCECKDKDGNHIIDDGNVFTSVILLARCL